ncbi:elongation factor P maturation arginine rhamnosyltransferase EarP [Rheinheimera texasensis]|uniref:elongation factor P maturation arginine rhamnosyltransferase EarP n=1 Tax=Rheinheimera texasensis TaxID=306205 RepID=UPI0032B232FE
MTDVAVSNPCIEPVLPVVIFCSVVDNFGDIGICWRLARQLVAEQHCQVRLFVDDLESFARICPELDPKQSRQQMNGVTVLYWQSAVAPQHQLTPAELTQTALCIEALACTIPAEFLNALALANPNALWLNLEYLTAEDWAAGCHGLPSPQQGVRLKKYFFFPGFTADVGGLLREQHVVAQAQALQQSTQLQQQAWQQLGLNPPAPGSRVMSLFAYSQTGIASWLALLAQDVRPNLLLVAEGALAESLRRQYPDLATNGKFVQGSLTLQILPFVPQPDYDLLLALCDLNFVRGEDSVIRAHWAGKPFIWQIYRQAEAAHLDKLQAFLQLMLADAPEALAELMLALHLAFEQEQNFAELWPEFIQNYDAIQSLTLDWQGKLLAQQDLASNLVRFVQNHHIMSRNFS